MQYWQVVAIVTLTHLAMLFLGMWLQWRRDKAHVQTLKAENDALLSELAYANYLIESFDDDEMGDEVDPAHDETDPVTRMDYPDDAEWDAEPRRWRGRKVVSDMVDDNPFVC